MRVQLAATFWHSAVFRQAQIVESPGAARIAARTPSATCYKPATYKAGFGFGVLECLLSCKINTSMDGPGWDTGEPVIASVFDT
jgi:hypothetical protein